MGTENGQSAKSAYLAELRAQVARLNALIEAVESGGEGLEGVGGGTPVTRADTEVRPDSFYNLSTPQATRKFLEMMGKGNPQTPQAIADALVRGGMAKAEDLATVTKNVYTALKRGRGSDFVKIAKEWGLAEWYPNRAKGEEQKGKPRKRRKKRTARQAKRKTESPKPTSATIGSSRPKSGFGEFNQFVKEQMAAGKTRNEAITAWQNRKPESG